MRFVAGLLVVLVLVGFAFTVIRSVWMRQRRQRRAARRGMRIHISGDGSAEKPTDLKDD